MSTRLLILELALARMAVNSDNFAQPPRLFDRTDPSSAASSLDTSAWDQP